MENRNNGMIPDDELISVSGGVARGTEIKQMGTTYYRIARGDTLQDIAERFHTSSEAIRALNPALIKNIDASLREGQEIRIR